MHSKHLVDPELLAALDALPPLLLSTESLPEVRAAAWQFPEDPGAAAAVDSARRVVPGPAECPDVGVLIHTPQRRERPTPCIVHMHGGGYVTGAASSLAPIHRSVAAAANCVIVSVDYRLAPETRFPGAIEDCYAALAWVFANAESLDIDRRRVGVMGESAGGGLAAALALLARDRKEYSLAFQHLIYPMIDDRTCAAQVPHPYAGEFLWTAHNNRFGWSALLGVAPGSENVSPYAAPARAASLAGLPPTFISAGALDLFVEEDMEYARRLVRAGVPVEMHVYPGAFHAFDILANARVSADANRDSMAALRRALLAQWR